MTRLKWNIQTVFTEPIGHTNFSRLRGLMHLGLLDLILLGLATWRLSYLIVKEDTPFNLMKRFRERHPDWGVFHCLYCASVWMALVIYLFWHIPYLNYVVYIFAISGLCLMLASYSGANHPPPSE
jgi:hypothetical protein